MKFNHDRPLSDFQEEIDLIKSNGFNPIGVSQMYMEDTFIFETEEEATKAYNLLEEDKKILCGWWYSKFDFESEVREYEKEGSSIVKVYWF